MEANRQKEELAEIMRLMFEQHGEMASALSGQSLPEGVQVHSIAPDEEMPPLEPINKVRIQEEEGEEEEPEDDPIVDVKEKKRGKDNDGDVRTTVTNAEIIEMHEKANEMELQDVEDEGVDDETNFKNSLISIKWMWPVYLAKKPRTMMDSIISQLHQFNVINPDKYDEFKELLDEYNNTIGVERKTVKNQLQKYYEDNVCNKYFVEKPRSTTQ